MTHCISLKVCLESRPLVSVKAIHVLQEVWHKSSKVCSEVYCRHVVYSDGNLGKQKTHFLPSLERYTLFS